MAPISEHKPVPPAAKPSRNIFDAWNSSSTGHQRAENRLSGSTAWRDSRTAKLAGQLADPLAGGARRVYDTVGAGSKDFGADGRLDNGAYVRGASGLRGAGQASLVEVWQAQAGSAAGTAADSTPDGRDGKQQETASPHLEQGANESMPESGQPSPRKPTTSQIFRGVVIYVNGSTASAGVSDLHLKRLVVQHGGRVVLGHARRTVTHVIVGDAGGGLAGGKIQKEIAALKSGPRYVTADWVTASVAAGRRLGEAAYSLRLAGAGQGGVRAALERARPP